MKRKFLIACAVASLFGGLGWQVAAAATGGNSGRTTPISATSGSVQASTVADGNQCYSSDNCCQSNEESRSSSNNNDCCQSNEESRSSSNNNDCCQSNGRDQGTSNNNDGDQGGSSGNCCDNDGDRGTDDDGNDGGTCPYGPNAPGITTSSGSCHRGNSLTVNGSNFAASETVTLKLDSSPSVTLGTDPSSHSGSFSTSVKIPSTVKPGAYALVATGSTGASASTELDVTP
jgi:hypothetical protein